MQVCKMSPSAVGESIDKLQASVSSALASLPQDVVASLFQFAVGQLAICGAVAEEEARLRPPPLVKVITYSLWPMAHDACHGPHMHIARHARPRRLCVKPLRRRPFPPRYPVGCVPGTTLWHTHTRPHTLKKSLWQPARMPPNRCAVG